MKAVLYLLSVVVIAVAVTDGFNSPSSVVGHGIAWRLYIRLA